MPITAHLGPREGQQRHRPEPHGNGYPGLSPNSPTRSVKPCSWRWGTLLAAERIAFVLHDIFAVPSMRSHVAGRARREAMNASGP
jgi:hypothetical protein